MRLLATVVASALLVAGCSTSGGSALGPLAPSPAPRATTPLRPQVTDPRDLYAADRPDALSPEAAKARPLVYVPDDRNARVDVIDPRTYKVIAHEPVGTLPQHVTPSWDLKTLWVDNDEGNSLTPIDPRTGAFGTSVPVTDPYNLYFTIDGRSAVVVAEARRRLDFRDPHTMALQSSLTVPCKGIDHADFSADGTHALFSCEFSGDLLWIDMVHRKVDRVLHLPRRSGQSPKPQDVKLSPDGKTFYVADENADGVYLVDARTLRLRPFVFTGQGAHGLYVSRDSKDLYVTDRIGGNVAVLSFATMRVRATWLIPGGSPDMGGVSADGKVLWLSGRYSGEVYALSTVTGHLLARIKVGGEPHGLCVWPQPGHFSLGHTGVLR